MPSMLTLSSVLDTTNDHPAALKIWSKVDGTKILQLTSLYIRATYEELGTLSVSFFSHVGN